MGPRSRSSDEHTRRWRMDTGPGWGARSTRVLLGGVLVSSCWFLVAGNCAERPKGRTNEQPV